ncbi:MAG: DUF1801 domain-containing protein [Bacteroidota bacterium]|nr:DUF1801 domain-containing protein [Bacteroidota bacterium]
MQIEATTVDDYISKLPEGRREAIQKLRKLIRENLPEGFEETLSYGMIAYVVPHSLYPKGYHADPKLALPFISIASQKNHIALYHMALYTDPGLMEWFTKEYPAYMKTRLDMGKSCVRFKKAENIPFELIGELSKKVSPQDWIKTYEKYRNSR